MHTSRPRRSRRPIHFGAGLILLILLGTGLTMLNIELSGLLGRMGSVLLALAVAGPFTSILAQAAGSPDLAEAITSLLDQLDNADDTTA